MQRQESHDMAHGDDDSITPSPGIESEDKSFDFESSSGNLTAALQTEKEFLNFMFSLPKNQPLEDHSDHESQLPMNIDDILSSSKKAKISPKPSENAITNASHVGLNHLDNLCKMMEQLKELRHHNSRLQRRVQYLEDLKKFQEMHRDIHDSMNGTCTTLAHEPLSSAHSNLKIDQFNDSTLFHMSSQDSINPSTLSDKEYRMKLPDTQNPSMLESLSGEDDRRSLARLDLRQNQKAKKEGRSAWLKVKNMINYNKKDANRKRSLPVNQDRTNAPPQLLSHSMSTTCAKAAFYDDRLVETAVSDPEDYDLEGDTFDGEGYSLECETDVENGIWISSKKKDSEVARNLNDMLKKKPQFTITVPSNEDLSTGKTGGKHGAQKDWSDSHSSQSKSPVVEAKNSSSLTPPSPRRTSNWSKVKQAFLTNHSPTKSNTTKNQCSDHCSPPASPFKKHSQPQMFKFHLSANDAKVPHDDSDSTTPRLSPELCPGESPDKSHWSPKVSPGFNQIGTQKNLAELQKTLTGEFSKKLHEWEKLKKAVGGTSSHVIADDDLPHEFRKKLHEWEKRKRRSKDKSALPINLHHPHANLTSHFDLKTRNYEENDLPPEFKKKFTEWQIRKALVGKGEQDVEAIQKNLGKEFNRKMAEWKRMKKLGTYAMQRDVSGLSKRQFNARFASPVSPVSDRLEAAALGAGSFIGPTASSKLMKGKISKLDKHANSKPEFGSKNKAKELQWLEKELNKIERHKQRLEREREKFVEREARLEKMKHAMRDAPSEKKDICIKTSTGEFRFEGISQTFTKKLYEWEERRGIRAESSTFVLLDPNYKAPNEDLNLKQMANETKHIIRSRSESSLAEINQSAISSINSNTSTASLDHVHRDELSTMQGDSKTTSEPALCGTTPDQVVCHDDEKLIDELRKSSLELIRHAVIESHLASMPNNSNDVNPQADVSKSGVGNEEEATDGHALSKKVCLGRTDSTKSEEDYRSLIHENMTLLGRLKEKETVCREIETQMGDLDYKMDSVVDQHFKTMERLQRHVKIMRKSESFGRRSRGSLYMDEEGEGEKNRLLIEQLRARIVELEDKGNKLMEDKEDLEVAFKLHKEQETIIAESLLVRIRELQDAGAEVNIQTVQCQTQETPPNDSDGSTSDERSKKRSSVEKKTRRKRRELPPADDTDDTLRRQRTEKKNRKRRSRPRNVQKLHNLTSNLLLQAKQLEQALIRRHNLPDEQQQLDEKKSSIGKSRSLHSQSSLKLNHEDQRRCQCQPKSNRTWASIEDVFHEGTSKEWAKAIATESEDLLHLNSELTRMAHELRRELTAIWNAKESASESNSSDARADLMENVNGRNFLKMEEEEHKLDEEEMWLEQQAREVFQSIASLHDITEKYSSDEHVEKVLPFYLVSSDDSINESSTKASNRNWDERRALRGYSEMLTSDENLAGNTSIAPKRRKARKNLSDTRHSVELSGPAVYSGSVEELDLDATILGGSGTTFADLVKADKRRHTRSFSGYSRHNVFGRSSSGSYDEADVSESSTSSSDCSRSKNCNVESLKTPQNATQSLTDSFKSSAASTMRSAILSSSFEYDAKVEPYANGDSATSLSKTQLANGTSNLQLKTHTDAKPSERCVSFTTDANSPNMLGSPFDEGVQADTASYETKVQYEPNSKRKVLRTRRVSDTQVKYQEYWSNEMNRETRNGNNGKLEMEKADSVRRNQSENNISLQQPSSDDSDNETNDIFVATRRTIFSLYNEQPTDDETNEQKPTLFERRRKKKLDSASMLPPLPMQPRVSSVYETRLNETLSLHQTDPRTSTDFDLASAKASPDKSLSQQTPEEVKKQELSGNADSPDICSSVKNMVEIYNNRITKNQKLLISPFTMEDRLTDTKSSPPICKSKSVSHMAGRLINSNVPRCSSSSQVPEMTSVITSRRKHGVVQQHRPDIQWQEKGFVDNRIVGVCFGEDDNNTFQETNMNQANQAESRAAQVKRARDAFLKRKHPDHPISEKINTTDERVISRFNHSSNLSNNFSEECLLDSSLSEAVSTKPPQKPHRHLPSDVHSALCKQESFRRRSEGCDSSTPPADISNQMPPLAGNIVSSSSASNINGRSRSVSTGKKSSLGLLKIFRKSKEKPKNTGAVEKLCRQSLHVNIDTKARPLSTGCQSHHLLDVRQGQDSLSPYSHSPRTLPRESSMQVGTHSAHSCPSSPVSRPKSKTAQLIQRSKKLFKSRPPQPPKNKR